MTSAAALPETIAAADFVLTGQVQGVGMRPAIARLAARHELRGSVRNTQEGVHIHVEGSAGDINRFERELPQGIPLMAVVTQIERRAAAMAGQSDFTIDDSESSKLMSTIVPPDLAACQECRAEALSDTNRRSGYAFSSCTNCGPRYSVIHAMPFDRHATSMSAFELCPECHREFGDSHDRRFHAQTTACEQCGPTLTCCAAHSADSVSGASAIAEAPCVIRGGGIVALKGVGGYQLICDASSDSAVSRLRRRKQRPTKPLAVMVQSVALAERYALLSEAARTALSSPQNPIVLVPARSGSLSPFVNIHVNHIGLLLPTTPLHVMLLDAVDRPCVVTSGNAHGEPLAFSNESAVEELASIADGWLHHNRNISRPVDDSVMKIICERPVTIRAARGIAPMSLAIRTDEQILAVGGHQKVAVALSNGAQAVLGPHLGDMSSVGIRQRFTDHVERMKQLYQFEPTTIAHDLHPDFFTTRWATEQRIRTVGVQHHHAHVVAGMLDRNWLDREVLGVAFDGTGYGPDGTVWGGEFLLSTATSYRRVARLRPFPLVGGERAIREPWRIAATLLTESGIDSRDVPIQFDSTLKKAFQQLPMNHGLFPVTSSAGRLFDGVASLLLGIDDVSFEGEAAMRLEAICDESATGSYTWSARPGEISELDWRPMIREIVRDHRSGLSPGIIAAKFTRSIADGIRNICEIFGSHPVVLTGGCFQNSILTGHTAVALRNHVEPVGFPGRIPPNDGGLAAGQLAVAAARLAALKGHS